MRALGRTMLAAAVAFLIVSLAEGQQRPLGGGGFGQRDLNSLLNSADVKKELGITEEQSEKLPSALLKALGDVLDAKQLKRLQQIELQTKGNSAFLDARVQKELGLSTEQTGNIKTILDDSRKEIAELFKDAKGGGAGEKMTALRKETAEKVQGVLTSDQKKAYKQMLGEEFKFEQRTPFGTGDGKKKFDFKKKAKNDA